MLRSRSDAAPTPSTGQLSTVFASAEVDQDPNVTVLRASGRIQKLTQATDALIARDFVLREEEAILDDLEACIVSLEDEVREAETQTEELRKRSSLLHPGKRRAIVGENPEVSALWGKYGKSMGSLVKQHSLRLVELEKALATASSGISELSVPEPLPRPPVVKASTTTVTTGNASSKQEVLL
ncbi:hypothetical protein JKF63_00358 [Porcisia hertigi]|uniref:Uncharacterized protein n=1 Tax=Porcisia hertigi TaxID=2761500 RepID=A0A836HEZ2_9TRYP|nr:hypothetical protein JKF63_00358 [Porcisia hertigi]